ncbi:MAG TPA: DnaB-like helicase C-terminal domain-containing protein, partial [Candidatus Pacearchaeota archaeon]|nr:DnaB-like helicase C-terminal domain-containing protein [Candidatus Pacearchaeota archaeon]
AIHLNLNNHYADYVDLVDAYDITLYKEAIRTLKKGYYQKKIKEIVSQEMEKLQDEQLKTSDIILAVNNIIQQLSDVQLVEDNTTHNISDIAMPYLERLDALKESKEFIGIMTGFSSIDDITCGITGNQYIVIGANSSIGKSSFALNMIRNMLHAGKGVVLFSLEMNEQQILNRLIAIETQIPLIKFKNKEPFTEQEYKQIGEAAQWYKNTNLWINTDMAITTEEIISYSAQLRKKYNIDAIFIDHIGLLGQNEKGDDIRLKMNYVSRQIKRVTKELNIPIFVLTQVNRDSTDQYTQKRPSISRIKETKAIEEDADMVLMLHRLTKLDNGDIAPLEEQQKMIVYIDKNRDGALAEIKMLFDVDCQRIIDYKDLIPHYEILQNDIK